MKKGIIVILITLISIVSGISKTNALEITQDVKLWGSKQFNYTNSDLTKNSIFTGKNFSRNNSLQYFAWDIDPNTYDYETNVDYIEIPLLMGQSNITKEDETSLTEYCTEWKEVIKDEIPFYMCTKVYGYNNDEFEYKPEVVLNNLNISFYAHNTDGGYSMCQIQNNSILCPTRKMKVDFIGMFYFFKSESNIDSLPIYLGNVWQRYYISNFQEQINQNQQQTNDILSGEQNYNKDASEEVNGQEEINDYTEKEEELFSSLNFEGIGNNEITINPNTSTFIWGIIERLRGMNGKIVLLITSILGLGIIKMILNR